MARRLNTKDKNFAADFEALLFAKREVEEDVAAGVKRIIADVRARGDAALVELSNQFDRANLTEATLKIPAAEIDAAVAQVPAPQKAAIETAATRIEAYHKRQIPEGAEFKDATGARLGWRWTPVDSAGLYVPGGTASYPSSVLMNAIPARVAGVGRIMMVTPASGGKINPLVLAAAKLAGVSEIYRVGGAQAIAALAYGTPSIRPVAKIVGPGNAYVAAAKRRVFGIVGIDMIAGPSEVVVLADSSADPRYVAADLLAQAEHDEAAQSILVTDDSGLARDVSAEVERQLALLPRAEMAGARWGDNGAIILVPSLAAAAPLIDRLAPEHLEIIARDADAISVAINNAGAVFLGAHTPEAIGDYVGGSNHVLPTSRSARFSSGLGVYDFVKRTSILKCDARSLAALGPSAIVLGEAEGLVAHARSVAIRQPRDSSG